MSGRPVSEWEVWDELAELVPGIEHGMDLEDALILIRDELMRLNEVESVVLQ